MKLSLYLALWVPFAALWWLIVYLGRGSAGFALLASLCLIGAAAGMGLAVWRLAGRYPWPAQRRLRFLARHVLFALAYALVLIAADAVLGAAYERRAPSAFLRDHPSWSVFEVVIYTWLYGLVAGVSYTVRAQRLLAAQRLAAARAEASAREAQLRALRAQINPHFLFNALHSLSALVRHDSATAERALERLGQLLRYALDDRARDEVALADEWDFARHYLDLESLRLGRRLRVTSELEPDALECLVPPFLIQPLVENAVRHGIAPRPQGGCVSVRARVDGDRLVLCVSDDGAGAEPAALEAAEGLGLRALRLRLLARYDGGSCIRIDTAPGAGFAATVTLPAYASPA
jgi:signal transduction histidine kinase